MAQELESANLPMLRNISDPFHAAGLELDLGIKPPGHGLVDDVLLLLLEQFDEPPLVADELVELCGFISHEPRNCLLLFRQRNGER